MRRRPRFEADARRLRRMRRAIANSRSVAESAERLEVVGIGLASAQAEYFKRRPPPFISLSLHSFVSLSKRAKHQNCG